MEGRDTAKHLTMHRTAHDNEELTSLICQQPQGWELGMEAPIAWVQLVR